MTVDPALLEKAVQRERRRSQRDWYGIALYAFSCFGILSFVFASVGRVPFPKRFYVAALGGLIGGTVTIFGVRLAQSFAQFGLRALLEPGGSGRDTAVYSHAEALAVQGNLEAASKAFDQARAEHGERASLLRAEADIQLRQEGSPERARELLMRLRRSSDASRADELYATHRLVDLYLGPLQDDARAMAELRRLAERFPGTRDAEGALAELQRRRALMIDRSEQP